MRLLTMLCCCSAAVAQADILPAAASTWPGRWGNQTLFFHNAWSPGQANEARTQLVYALAELPANRQPVTALAFRTWDQPIANRGGSIDLSIRMSTSAIDPDQASHVFAQNEGPAPQLVFQGVVTLPATPASGGWPQPWSVVVPLQTPFVLAPAVGDRALVIDVRCWNSTVGEPWIAEMYDVDDGTYEAELWQGNCLMASGSPQLQWFGSGTQLIAGGALYLTYGMYPGNHPSLAVNTLCLGVQGVGGSYNGIPLPVSLGVLGVPTPPNCVWTVAPLLSVPMSYSTVGTDGFLDVVLPIPNDPRLVGLRLVAQDAALMQYATGMQVYPSSAVALTIRSGAAPSGSSIAAGGDRNATIGAPSRRRPVAVELR